MGTPLFWYSNHARRRMVDRGVTELEVEQTVLSPDRWYYGEQGEINAVKDFGTHRLRVPYESTPEQIRVITVIEE